MVTFSPSQTKIMTCSNRAPVYQPANTFNHKHLGLTLNNKLQWTCHIDKIIESVSPMMSILKALKYKIDKESIKNLFQLH